MPDLNSVHQLLFTDPLTNSEDIEQYYVNLFASRGDNPIKPLKRRLDNNPQGKLQILFSGYRGCGKSTELNKLKTEIENDFIVVGFSVLKDLDLMNINYTELITLTMEKLFEQADKQKVEVSKQLLNSINAWLQTEEIVKIRTFGADLTAEAGAEVGASVWSLVKFWGKLRAASNASYTTKRTITEVVERRLSDLINHCNDLIKEVKLGLPKVGKKGLVIIIEDLDKLSLDKAEELFFRYSNVLTSLFANVVFTFPISLRHHPQAKPILDNFSSSFELPMVKVKTKQGEPYEQGRKDLFALVTKRITIDNFEQPQLLYQFIDLSGGCIRDLFRLIRDAADNALNDERTTISGADYTKAFFKLKRNYEYTINEKRIGDKLITPVEEYYKALAAIATDPNKRASGSQVELDLRQNLCLLSYNDEGWCDVHPVVRHILQERNLIPAP